MKKGKSIIIILSFAAVFTLGFFLLCRYDLIEKKNEYATQKYTLNDINFVNIEKEKGTLVAGEDPQMILQSVNRYVESILIIGLQTDEKIQVFYSEENEPFSEEKSIIDFPKATDNGVSIKLDKNVSDVRIDFIGSVGEKYNVSEIVVNPASYEEWSVGGALFFAIFGGLVGCCCIFLFTEGKNIPIYFQALKKYRYLLEDMVGRDIKLKYRRSVIGLLWSILNPLLMMIVITAVFQNLFRFSIENFAVYYLTGWVVFNFITEATSGAMNSIIGSSSLIRKVYIPKYIFPMQKCVFSFVNMLFSLIALFVVMIVLRVKVTWTVLLIPIPLILALFFAIGLGMILATAAVFFRDAIHLYGVFTMVWMYLTPIIYPEEILTGVMKVIMRLNPMYYYVGCFRNMTMYGMIPEIRDIVIMIICSALSLLLGIAIFKKKQDHFILYI